MDLVFKPKEFLWCFNEVSIMFTGSFAFVKVVGSSKEVSKVSQRSFEEISRLF